MLSNKCKTFFPISRLYIPTVEFELCQSSKFSFAFLEQYEQISNVMSYWIFKQMQKIELEIELCDRMSCLDAKGYLLLKYRNANTTSLKEFEDSRPFFLHLSNSMACWIQWFGHSESWRKLFFQPTDCSQFVR